MAMKNMTDGGGRGRGGAMGGKTPTQAPSYSEAVKKQSPSPHSQTKVGMPGTRMTVGTRQATPIMTRRKYPGRARSGGSR